MELYAKGKRGLVYLTDFKGEKIAVKKKNPSSTAIARIDIEAQFLPLLNKHTIGPKFLFFENNELGMEFIEGMLFEEYLVTASKAKIKKAIDSLFEQMRVLDALGINKEEMHHPFKHIIVRDDKPVLIDFERCRYTEKPKNVAQLLQYVSGKKIRDMLAKKEIHIEREEVISLSKEYKQELDFSGIRRFLKLL